LTWIERELQIVCCLGNGIANSLNRRAPLEVDPAESWCKSRRLCHQSDFHLAPKPSPDFLLKSFEKRPFMNGSVFGQGG